MKKAYETTPIIKVSPPKKTDIRTIRLLIVCGLLVMLIFIAWFVKPEHIGYGPIYWLLTFALLFKLVKMIHEWYHYWSLSVPEKPEWKKQFTVDVLTTACPGEPREMIIRTLHAMVAIRYPHTNYLCDEGDDPILKKVCEELGVVHVTRTIKIDAKAGNINNALKQASGEICVVLDPDHVPVPEFLDQVLPYFEDEQIGFVQCVQAYGNQSESLIARGAAEQTYHFYGPMMMCMNSYGTVQAIGANCTFRRTALDSIGGHAAGLSEDMHTAMQLHAKGWKSVYIPEALTRGLVPATLSSYYKQQLKWSRGTFELLFRTYPVLYKNFTWRQKIHYFTIPLYFLFGLINFIDILIPIIALCLAQVPWEVNLNDFAILFLPLCGLSMTIRLFAQRWLVEEHERGFHLAGGILRAATWWIFLVGFIYAIFKIKVPYIPTPKEDVHENYWKLSIPNFLVAFFCSAAILYGLAIDWTPYSIAMAFYAFLNAGMLAVVVLLSQQKFVAESSRWLSTFSIYNHVQSALGSVVLRVQHAFASLLRNGPAATVVGLSMLFLSYNNIEEENDLSGISKEKFFGGFYAGISTEGSDDAAISRLSAAIDRNVEILSFTDTLDQDIAKLEEKLGHIQKSGKMPLLTWIVPTDVRHATMVTDLEKYAQVFRRYGGPLFLNPRFINKDSDYAKSDWQYLFTFFNDLGISNLTWVWTPTKRGVAEGYPGEKFVDWVGVDVMNYGDDRSDNDWYSFSQIYTPYRDMMGSIQKPVIICQFGCVKGPSQQFWLDEAFKEIREKFTEVSSVVFFQDQKQFHIPAGKGTEAYDYTASFSLQGATPLIREYLSQEPFNKKPFLESDFKFLQTFKKDYHSAFVSGKPGDFTLNISGNEWYIRGVAYNPGHDWRDGNNPLTRRHLEKDFAEIRDMGANVIRRYNPSFYDQNILNIAGEYNLKVLYGFWFDPKIDYYSDTNSVKKYMEDVEEKVREFKDHPSVLAWSLGNETWGLLKHKYSKPYLTKVREHYVKMIEVLAERIHEIDPTRPVLTSMEHEKYQLPGELVAFRDGAPSIDVIAINSYYEEQVRRLNHICYQFDSLRPYLVSEFGPKGYWDPDYNRSSNGLLVEDNEKEKAEWYTRQWNNYISAYKGHNIGGVAYCWHDRMEGTYTWYGLSDHKGRLKPSYYALKSTWTGRQAGDILPAFSIKSPAKIRPGQKYTFRAVTGKGLKQDVEYEWYLMKDDYLEKVDNIEMEGEGSMQLTVPEQASSYRLYLFVSDKHNNVSTASVPILVK